MKLAITACSRIQKTPVQLAWKKIERERPDLLLMLQQQRLKVLK